MPLAAGAAAPDAAAVQRASASSATAGAVIVHGKFAADSHRTAGIFLHFSRQSPLEPVKAYTGADKQGLTRTRVQLIPQHASLRDSTLPDTVAAISLTTFGDAATAGTDMPRSRTGMASFNNKIVHMKHSIAN